jgi:hypothetical protein
MDLGTAAVITSVAGVSRLLFLVIQIAEKLPSKIGEYKECGIRMMQYHTRLEAVHVEFVAWQQIWLLDSVKPLHHSAYEYFWGERGTRSIQAELNSMEYEIRKIEDILYAGPELEEFKQRDRETWGAALRSESQDGRHESTRKHKPTELNSVRKKIVFALMKSTTLKDRLNRLETGLKVVKTISRISFWTHQGLPEHINRQLPRSDLARLHAAKTGIRDLACFATQLKATLDASRGEWALVLGKPALEKAWECFEDNDTDIFPEVLGGRGLKHDYPDTRVFNVRYHRDEDEQDVYLYNFVWGWLRDPVEALPTVLPCNSQLVVCMDLRLLAAQEGKDWRPLRKDMITKLAKDLVTTAVLFYGTSWMRPFCIHQIRYLLCDRAGGFAFALDSRHDGCQSVFTDRVFLLLAAVLSELVMLERITVVRSAESELEFSFINRGARGAKGGRAHLLTELCKVAGRHFKNAVHSCLDLDAKLLEQGYHPSNNRPEILWRFHEEIKKQCVS